MVGTRLAEDPKPSRLYTKAFDLERGRVREVTNTLRLFGLPVSGSKLVNRLNNEDYRIRRVAVKEADQLASAAEEI
jgi:hypothetical protein